MQKDENGSEAYSVLLLVDGSRDFSDYISFPQRKRHPLRLVL